MQAFADVLLRDAGVADGNGRRAGLKDVCRGRDVDVERLVELRSAGTRRIGVAEGLTGAQLKPMVCFGLAGLGGERRVESWKERVERCLDELRLPCTLLAE